MRCESRPGANALFCVILAATDVLWETNKTATQIMRPILSFQAVTALVSALVLMAPVQFTRGQEKHPPSPTAAQPNAQLRYDIEIENGELLTAPFKRYVDVNALWGPGSIASVPATIENLARFMRAADTNLNLVVSPDAAQVTIQNLKLRSADIAELVEALGYATDGKLRGLRFANTAGNNWTLMARPERKAERTVEVFNLNGFIERHGRGDTSGKSVSEQLDRIQQMILETLIDLKRGELTKDERPEFRFHSGTGLLIVIGTPTAMEVTRKVVSALPGQSESGARQDPLDSSAHPKEK